MGLRKGEMRPQNVEKWKPKLGFWGQRKKCMMLFPWTFEDPLSVWIASFLQEKKISSISTNFSKYPQKCSVCLNSSLWLQTGLLFSEESYVQQVAGFSYFQSQVSKLSSFLKREGEWISKSEWECEECIDFSTVLLRILLFLPGILKSRTLCSRLILCYLLRLICTVVFGTEKLYCFRNY